MLLFDISLSDHFVYDVTMKQCTDLLKSNLVTVYVTRSSRRLHTVVAVHCHGGDLRGLGKANDELLRKHPGGHPERFGTSGARNKQKLSVKAEVTLGFFDV